MPGFDHAQGHVSVSAYQNKVPTSRQISAPVNGELSKTDALKIIMS